MARHQAALPPLKIDKTILMETLRRSNPQEPVERLDPIGDRMAALMEAAMQVVVASAGRDVQFLGLGAPDVPVTALEGEGLGAPLDRQGADEALDTVTVRTPLGSWAGEVLSSQAVADRLGVSKTTVNNWRQDAAVIALPKGRRNFVYPLAQFRDGEVLPGIAEVLAAAGGDSRVAWRWLLTAHVDFDGAPPLAALQQGAREAVVAAADRSLG